MTSTMYITNCKKQAPNIYKGFLLFRRISFLHPFCYIMSSYYFVQFQNGGHHCISKLNILKTRNTSERSERMKEVAFFFSRNHNNLNLFIYNYVNL